MKLIKFLINLYKLNISSTLYFNFKMLKFKDALKLPVYIYGKTDFRNLSGNLIIKGALSRGMIVIGKSNYVKNQIGIFTLTLAGDLIFNGKINIYSGVYIFLSKNAQLNIGTNRTFIGTNSKIICFDNISIGNNVEITWDCQIMDSNFHYFEEPNINKLTKPIVIEDNVWIGNRVSLMPGSVIPSYSTITSNSLVNKNFIEFGNNIIIGGIPAKFIKGDITRIFDESFEAIQDKKFNYNRIRL